MNSSPTDPLQPTDDKFDPNNQPRLAEDGSPPAANPDDVGSQSLNQPAQDTNIDKHEVYDASPETAAGLNAQHHDNPDPL
jgi:hypothetical protein